MKLVVIQSILTIAVFLLSYFMVYYYSSRNSSLEYGRRTARRFIKWMAATLVLTLVVYFFFKHL